MIARVRATDADAGANAVLSYSLEGDEDKMFSITPETGEVRLEKNRVEPESLSDEVSKENVYHLVVVVSDGGELTFRISLFKNCFITCCTITVVFYIIFFASTQS